MRQRKILKTLGYTGLISIMLLGQSTGVFARPAPKNRPVSHHSREIKQLPRNSSRIVVDGHRYHYNRGRFYRPHDSGYIMVSAPIGAIIIRLPWWHKKVIVKGKTYYRYGGVYYTRCPQGYMVVPDPTACCAASTTTTVNETVTVYIPNANGSYTAVMLERSANGYIGPQKEFYPEHPTVDQLAVLYGK